MRRAALVLALPLASLAAPGLAGGLLPYTDPDRVAEGRTLYAEQCAACHGADLSGEANWREQNADGTLPAPPHDETGHTWHHPDALLVRIVTEGTEAIVGGDYRSAMIGFGDILSEDEILNVLAYIKSTWPDEIIETHDAMNARAPG
ncbi:c-type cytochrome [Ponticoccus sp. (in: a-proteobacteria)]|uniref:c-type cytochrome n=1 Tax=Ponticoccus sp. (in: a-proteobacteria) TaxID=1925025 RepID=UPI003AB20A36